MKWFKHKVTGRRGNRLNEIYSKLGYHRGYALYFMLMELCAERFDGTTTRFKIPIREVTETLQTSKKIATTLLQLLNSSKLVSNFQIDPNSFYFEFEWPELLDITDEYTRKVRTMSGQKSGQCLPQIEKENKNKKKIKIKNNNIIPSGGKKTENSQAKALRAKIWNAYSLGYSKKYGTEPIRNAKRNAQVLQLEKRLGNNAPEVVEFFLNHPKQFYISKTHDLGLCLADAESLHTQWQQNVYVTENKVREFSKKLEVDERHQKDLEWAEREDAKDREIKQKLLNGGTL